MYLKRVSIRTFKTIQTLDIDLAEGLNVIFGLNEAGKSTFLDTLSAAFFVNADSNKSDVLKYRAWESAADPSVHVIFDAEGKEYSLEKTFLGARKGRLACTASGLDTTNKDRINEELAKLLPLGVVSEEAHKRTFWIAQRELEDTMESIEGDADIRTALKNAILKADADIEEIKSAVEVKIREMGKGSQRHALSPGPVEQSRRDAERLTTEANEMKNKLQSLERDAARQKELSEKVEALDKQIKDDTEILGAFEKYTQVKKSLESANRNLDLVQDAIESYRTSQSGLGETKKKVEDLAKEQTEVDAVIASLQRSEQVKQIEAQLKEEEALQATVILLEQQISEKKAGLDATQRVSKADLDSARTLEQGISTKSESLKAAQLSIEARGLSAAKMMIAEDGNPAHEESVQNKETRSFRANQKIGLTIPDVVELTISSGVSNAADLQKELKSAEVSFVGLLEKYAVSSLADLIAQFDEQQKLATDVSTLEAQIKGALGARTEAQLTSSVLTLRKRKEELAGGQVVKPGPGESIEICRTKRDQIVRDVAGLNAEVKQLESLGTKFLATYVNEEAANGKKREAVREAAKFEAALEATAKMELSDVDVFQRKQRLEKSQAEHQVSRDELLMLVGALQKASVSSDELHIKESELQEAEAAYAANVLEFDAYQVLALTLQQAEAEVSQHLVDPVQAIVSTTLPKLTAGRYSGVSLNEDLQIQSLKYKNLDVDPEDLSTGAKGQLALALRLALIEHLSSKERQMVVIDDALVNYDADRLAEAKLMIEEFSHRHQVVYLTCHSQVSEWEGAELHDL